LMAVMTAANGAVKVAEDFTADQAALETAIQNLNGSSSAPNPAALVTDLSAAARMLAAIDGKKTLIYFASGVDQAITDQQAAVQNAIKTAVQANVAFYPASGLTVRILPLPGAAQVRSDPMARIVQRHGQPDQIQSQQSGPNSVQIWRYNYLDNFHSNVEYEFTANGRRQEIRISWPPPVATFAGTPGASSHPNATAGLPGRHATMATYPADEIQTLTVPLDGLTGPVQIDARAESLPGGNGHTASGMGVSLIDSAQSYPSGQYQANWILPAGSYVCIVTVTEESTGRTYAETIDFQVQ